MNKILANKINKLAIIDQRMRRQARKIGRYDQSIDRANTLVLKKIINTYGWPTISMVGKRPSMNAWLIVQHADHDIRFQKKVLNNFKKIYTENPQDIDIRNIAYLSDRILVKEKKRQIFGTQFHWNKKGQLVSFPISNRKDVDRLRDNYNLPPLGKIMEEIKKSPPKILIKKIKIRH